MNHIIDVALVTFIFAAIVYLYVFFLGEDMLVKLELIHIYKSFKVKLVMLIVL